MARVLDRYTVFVKYLEKKNGSAFGQCVRYSLTSGQPVIQLGVRFGVTYPLNSVYQNVSMKPVESPNRQSFDKSPVVK